MIRRHHIKYQANKILNTESTKEDIVSATVNLHTLFSNITGIDGDIFQPIYDKDIPLENGIAISPCMAAHCLLLPLRTTMFIRGIKAGIDEGLNRFPNQPLQILYAGCGPYATLLLPLVTQYTPDQIQVTLLDFHQESIDAVKGLIGTLGLGDYFKDCIQTDATKYQHPQGQPIHMIVSETMTAALRSEPQVAVTLNLVPQLAKGGILIPQNISIEACLTDPTRERFGEFIKRDDLGFPSRHDGAYYGRTKLSKLLTLNIQSGLDIEKAQNWRQLNFPTRKVRITDYGISDNHTRFMLLTHIHIFKGITIQDYDTSITCPFILDDLSGLPVGTIIEFYYSCLQKPGFRYRVLSGDVDAKPNEWRRA